MINFNRFAPILAASLAVIATFAIGMPPWSPMPPPRKRRRSAPVEHVEVDENGVPSLRVSYAGLDMSNAQDRAEMHHRITRAATRVCAPLRDNTIEAERSIAYQNCRSDAIAQGQASHRWPGR
jgi:UrcA family protein